MTAADATLDERLGRLQNALIERSHERDNPVRAEGFRMALSAAVCRLINYGVEDTFNNYEPLDLLNLSLLGTGRGAADFIEIALMRAVVAADREAIDLVTEADLGRTMTPWIKHIQALGREEARAELARPREDLDLPTLDGGTSFAREELAALRILIGRRHPDLIEPDWLWSMPEDIPIFGHAMAKTIIDLRQDLHHSVRSFLKERPSALMYRDPDELLAPLVVAASESPQAVLAPFAGYYDEPTLITAAVWHIEHGQPQAALELAERIRPLSKWYDRALVIRGIVTARGGDIEGALALRRDILDLDEAASLIIVLDQLAPNRVANSELIDLAIPADHRRPERFVAAVQALVRRNCLELARSACFQAGEAFNHHPQVKEVINKVLGIT